MGRKSIEKKGRGVKGSETMGSWREKDRGKEKGKKRGRMIMVGRKATKK